ncbi:MAG: anti-anti-sigma factor [Candidatus Azotimanducaceae bacterium]|jgi:anti-anti-sigma factor
MSIWASASQDGRSLTINIEGRFDFSAHQDFRESYEKTDAEPDEYCVDMKQTSYLDSSALGMLLLLRDHAGGDSAKIKIVNCNTDVRKILKISNFEQLFTIE